MSGVVARERLAGLDNSALAHWIFIPRLDARDNRSDAGARGVLLGQEGG